ncbi:MAG: cupin domain-containing protein [Candidatus Dormibacteria bacterium]
MTTQPGGAFRLESTRTDKPWGYELRFAVTDRYLGKVIHVNEGQALSLQYHVKKDETLLVTQGRLDLELEVDGAMTTLHLGVGDCVRIAPPSRHRMVAATECEFVEVSSPEIDDVVRLEDRYGRAGS